MSRTTYSAPDRLRQGRGEHKIYHAQYLADSDLPYYLFACLRVLCCFASPVYARWPLTIWSGDIALVSISEVTLRPARLVLEWATVSVCYQPPRSTQPGRPFVARRSEYQCSAHLANCAFDQTRNWPNAQRVWSNAQIDRMRLTPT